MPLQSEGADIPLGRIDRSQLQSHIRLLPGNPGSAGAHHVVIFLPGSLTPNFLPLYVLTGSDGFRRKGDDLAVGMHVKPVESVLIVFLLEQIHQSAFEKELPHERPGLYNIFVSRDIVGIG